MSIRTEQYRQQLNEARDWAGWSENEKIDAEHTINHMFNNVIMLKQKVEEVAMIDSCTICLLRRKRDVNMIYAGYNEILTIYKGMLLKETELMKVYSRYTSLEKCQ